MFEASNIIALLTDFGTRDHYVGVMKGVILSISPHAQIIDITHDSEPQDVVGAYLLLRNTYRYFPRGTIFAAIVDPEVGTDRSILCVQSTDYLFLAPDNGLLGFLEQRDEIEQIYSVRNSKLFMKPVSSTFHGRDIFAPVAAHLSLGLDPSRVGPAIRTFRKLTAPEPTVSREGVIVGEIVSIDRFGNLVTNIPANRVTGSKNVEVRLGRRKIQGLLQTYGKSRKGTLLALTGSGGTVEIAVTRGNAAKKTRAKVGDIVRVTHS